MAEVFYRRWRPQTLTDVVGQDSIVQTLRQAVRHGRNSHAYLFCGTRGTGKTSTARILAKALNCLSPDDGEPDNTCSMCVAVTESRSLDLIEIDAASNRGIDDIRDLSEKVRFTPNEGRYKVYIVDEVHMLTQPAFNALLKTLEEPPPHAVFILATTEAHKVPATIISRCQRFDFRKIPVDQMTAKLKFICQQDNIEVNDDALLLISRVANGGLRDAENMLEQAIVSYGSPLRVENVRHLLGMGDETLALNMVHHLTTGNTTEALKIVEEAVAQGSDLPQLLRGIHEYLRAVLLIKANATSGLLHSDEIMGRLSGAARRVTSERLLYMLQAMSNVNLRRDQQSPLPLEIAVVKATEWSAGAGIDEPYEELPSADAQVSDTPDSDQESQQSVPCPEEHAVPTGQGSATIPEYQDPDGPADEFGMPDIGDDDGFFAEGAMASPQPVVSEPVATDKIEPEDDHAQQEPIVHQFGDELPLFSSPPVQPRTETDPGADLPDSATEDPEPALAASGEDPLDTPSDPTENMDEARATSESNDGDLSEEQWDRIAKRLRYKGEKLKLGPMLRSARRHVMTNDVVSLSYSSVSNAERMSKELDIPGSRRAFLEAVKEITGIDCQVVVENKEAGPETTKDYMRKSHLVQAAMAMGARPQEIRNRTG